MGILFAKCILLSQLIVEPKIMPTDRNTIDKQAELLWYAIIWASAIWIVN